MEKITQLDADGLRRPPVLGLIDKRHRLGRDAGAGQRLVYHGHHVLLVRPTGQLGHHATVGLVHLDLAVQRMRQQGGHSHPTS